VYIDVSNPVARSIPIVRPASMTRCRFPPARNVGVKTAALVRAEARDTSKSRVAGFGSVLVYPIQLENEFEHFSGFRLHFLGLARFL